MVRKQKNDSGRPIEDFDGRFDAAVGQPLRDALIDEALAFDAGQDEDQSPVEPLGGAAGGSAAGRKIARAGAAARPASTDSRERCLAVSHPQSGRSSMLEMPAARKQHGDLVLVAGGNHFGVVAAPSRLNDRRDSRLGRQVDAVAEGEKGVRGHDRPGLRPCDLCEAIITESTRLICPAPTPITIPSLGEHDRVRFDVPADGPGKFEVAQLAAGGGPLGDGLPFPFGAVRPVEILNEQSPRDPAIVAALADAAR